MKREYKLFLEDIIKSCEYVQEFVEGIDFDQFMNDEKTSSAVIQKFGIIGEAVKNIPEFIREKYSDIPWKNMAGMRDRLIHGYFGVDYALVWDTIEFDVPKIITLISQILDDLEKEQNTE